jgi:K319L-like, PKD domain
VVLSNSGAVRSSFTPTLTGTYEFSLTVSDGINLSQPDTVSVIVDAPANTVPTADAGLDQAVMAGTTVVLDGSRSLDPDGDRLIYFWTQVGGPVVSLFGSTSSQASFLPALAGVYQFNLVVSDGIADSPPAAVTVIVNAGNSVPTADAGPDQTVRTGDVVTLNGSGSADGDGDSLTYRWRQAGGTQVALSSPTGARPTFTAISPGVRIFNLIVNDGHVDSLPSSVAITVNLPNTVPIADAGPDLTGRAGQTFTLDGTGSVDPDGEPLSFAWSQIEGPSVVLSNPASAKPAFTSSVAGIYAFQLIVSDGQLQSLPALVWITVNGQNTIPIANAGPDQIVETGSVVTLDGSLSDDSDLDPLSYAWIQRGGTNIMLQGTNGVYPQFSPVDHKPYSFELVVDDGLYRSIPDRVNLYVMDRVVLKQMVSAASGGVLSITGGDLAGLQLMIPPGALKADTLIGIGEDFNLPRLSSNVIKSPATFEPEGLTFAQPASATIPYDTNRYKNPAKFKVYLYDDSVGQWVQIPIVGVDQAQGLVTINITHFSSVALTDDEGNLIQGGFGCGAVKNISPPKDPHVWPMDLVLLAAIILWLRLKNSRPVRYLVNKVRARTAALGPVWIELKTRSWVSDALQRSGGFL